MTMAQFSNNDEYMILNDTRVHLDRKNRRIKIQSYEPLGPDTLKQVVALAGPNEISKIIVTVPTCCEEWFNKHSFAVEGRIKGFFAGEDASCCSLFVTEQRKASPISYNGIFPSGCNWDLIVKPEKTSSLPYTVRNAGEPDIPGMIALFRRVFITYPSPVFDAQYLRTNIITNQVLYKLALHNGAVIGIASADKDQVNLNAEMTDCVTDPVYRGHGILTQLLAELEADLGRHDYVCLYTLCRATQAAINKAFLRRGYTYSGRMINNCNICGDFEDMNILVKNIKD